MFPDKVHSLLERRVDLGWYQMDIDVGMHRLTIPFDFSTVKDGQRQEKWRIGDEWWEEMMEEAQNQISSLVMLTGFICLELRR